jgi:hypothetical protein
MECEANIAGRPGDAEGIARVRALVQARRATYILFEVMQASSISKSQDRHQLERERSDIEVIFIFIISSRVSRV